jgi:hypothetical protein
MWKYQVHGILATIITLTKNSNENEKLRIVVDYQKAFKQINIIAA